jgi:hypothetical protein
VAGLARHYFLVTSSAKRGDHTPEFTCQQTHADPVDLATGTPQPPHGDACRVALSSNHAANRPDFSCLVQAPDCATFALATSMRG